MRYQVKVALFWLLEILPGRDKLYWLLQRYILRTQRFKQKNLEAHEKQCERYLESYKQNRGSLPVDLYEFGAGWFLYSPLIFASKGFKVTASDLKPLAKKQINEDVALRIGSNLEDIKYIAPCDAANSDLENSSFDLIYSTSVLEHIPKKKMSEVAAECHRLLRPSGICCFHVAHRDHWSHHDKYCHPMNYLRFSSWFWTLLNPPLNYQNRCYSQSTYHALRARALK